jgi:hypothetical protein
MAPLDPEAAKFLNLRIKPAFWFYHQVGYRLNLTEEEVRILVKKGLLEVCGDPRENARKKVAGCFVEQCAADADWLNKAAKAIYATWADKNARQQKKINGFPAKSKTAQNNQHRFKKKEPASCT